MLDNLKRIYSPNFDIKKRKPKSIEFIILHYTGMKKEKDALERLTNQNSKVSCHYFITYSGEIINLVPDLYTAWHAGISSWQNFKFLLEIAVKHKLYTPIDYKKNPKQYCGMEITDNPYYDL
mgnify:CR=1 FL=1